jgi:hypothetical protein
MRIHLWAVVVSVLLVATASDAAPPEPPPEPTVDDTHTVDLTATTRVPVRLYSSIPDHTADDQLMALAVAEDALSTASVGIAWTLCGPGECLTPAPAALKVRIVQSRDDSQRDSQHLGQALIDSQSGTGVLATVFIDRTRRLADHLGIDHRVLLGRTIAHELGHLLLATPTHGNSGLMREVWSRDELLGTRHSDWVFDPLDAAAIRDRLARLARRGIARPRGAS